jgi:tight adherence protein C
MLFVIGVLLIAVAAGLLLRAFMLSRVKTSTQLREIDTYGFNAAVVEAQPAAAPSPRSVLRGSVNELAERVGRRVRGQGWRAPVDGRSLRAAGVYSITPEAFHGYRVLAGLGLPALIFVPALLSGMVTFSRLVLTLVAGGVAWFGPAVFVRTRAQRRMDEVDRTLPELIDVLIATMEAGLGFAGSLQLVAARFGGPLGQELRLTLQEQRMGLSTENALTHLLERCDTPSMRAFVRGVLQGEALGVSIAAMMRNLATETRKRRRQNAHAQIQKAPVKMLFPLVFLIFPALMIVLLYPGLSELISGLNGS